MYKYKLHASGIAFLTLCAIEVCVCVLYVFLTWECII